MEETTDLEWQHRGDDWIAGELVTMMFEGAGRWSCFAGSAELGTLVQADGSLEEPWLHYRPARPGNDDLPETDDWRCAVSYLVKTSERVPRY